MVINDDILKQFNVTIGELSPKIIDSIVSIYGEKHRSLIQDRLNRIYIFISNVCININSI